MIRKSTVIKLFDGDIDSHLQTTRRRVCEYIERPMNGFVKSPGPNRSIKLATLFLSGMRAICRTSQTSPFIWLSLLHPTGI